MATQSIAAELSKAGMMAGLKLISGIVDDLLKEHPYMTAGMLAEAIKGLAENPKCAEIIGQIIDESDAKLNGMEGAK